VSEDRISVGKKRGAAQVLLPLPLAPIRATTQSSGMLILKGVGSIVLVYVLK